MEYIGVTEEQKMREIKFRGLRTDGNGWARGYVCITAGATCIMVDEFRYYQDADFENSFLEVIPETVGQYTGLTDKNGVDVYEGDLFTSNEYPFMDDGVEGYVGEVVWIQQGFQYFLKCVNHNLSGISEGLNESLEDCDWLEVIGNIHENNK